MMRTLNHASYVFEKKLSHTADSQDQRHRMVPASRPMMTLADTTQPDYITPRLIRQNAAALVVYEQAMADAWAAKNKLLALGVPLEYARAHFRDNPSGAVAEDRPCPRGRVRVPEL